MTTVGSAAPNRPRSFWVTTCCAPGCPASYKEDDRGQSFIKQLRQMGWFIRGIVVMCLAHAPKTKGTKDA